MEKKNILTAVGLFALAGVLVGAFIVFKTLNDKKTDDTNDEKIEQTVAADDSAEEKVEEPVVEEPVVEQPKRRKRTVKEANDELNNMTPMMMGNGDLPTKEEAINAAWDVLNAYRDATPEEKQQMEMGIMIMQGVVNALSMNAGALLERMPPEERERVANSAAASQELLYAVQEEMSDNVTDDEARVFGGLFQSFWNASQSFSNVPQYQQF